MKVLITGGAGFIGSNVAYSFLKEGHKVIVLDDYSRDGVLENVKWLSQNFSHTGRLQLVEGDIRYVGLRHALENIDVVFHFAAQVGVQASINDPHYDFTVNALGTFRLLDLVRELKKKPLFVFASTNKVYGDFATDKPVSESQPLSFCTPYGCSKGAADQYVLDYAKIFGVPGVVLRMSCIYGNRQFGTEEQGWLCHFMRNKENHVTVYGDGTQVRDALYIDDYVRLMHELVANKDIVKGQVFNIGGGEENAVSVNQVLKEIGNTNISFSDWRPADQKYYVSDITKITSFIKWRPEISVNEGLKKLKLWVNEL